MRDQNDLPLIQHKSDTKTARALAELGYPRVAPILPYILEWIQDGNWPVAHVVAPFLVSIGLPVLPEIRRVMSTNDDVWKYWCLVEVVAKLPTQVIREFQPDLERLANAPSVGEQEQQVTEEATRILRRIAEDGA